MSKELCKWPNVCLLINAVSKQEDFETGKLEPATNGGKERLYVCQFHTDLYFKPQMDLIYVYV